MRRLALWTVVLLGLAASAAAHGGSESLLRVQWLGSQAQLRWNIGLLDLHHALDLDTDGDGRLMWSEVEARADQIAEFVMGHLQVRADDEVCGETVLGTRVARHGAGGELVVDLALSCSSEVRRLELSSTLFRATDPSHRALIDLQWNGVARSAVLGPGRPALLLDLDSAAQHAEPR